MSNVVIAVVLMLPLVGIVRFRQATCLAFVMVILDGAIRKWVFPDAQQAVYFAKDALLIGAYIGAWRWRIASGLAPIPSHPANLPLLLLLLLVVVESFNPAVDNTPVALLGIKSYLIYIPLMYVIPALVSSREDLQRLTTWAFCLALIPLIVGPVQFASPGDSFINKYAWSDESSGGVAGFATLNRVRITGTFSYISGHSTFVALVLILGAPMLLYLRDLRARVLLIAMLVLAIGNLLMTGSRGPLFMVILGVASLLLLPGKMSLGGRCKAFAAVLVFPVILYSIVSLAFPDALDAYRYRAESTNDLESRVFGSFEPIARHAENAGLFGFGVGATHQARSLIDPLAERDPALASEGEFERILLELGPIGLFLTLLIRMLVVIRLWFAVREASGTVFMPYIAGAFLYALVAGSGHIVFNPVASMFYWGLAGFALIPLSAVKGSSRVFGAADGREGLAGRLLSAEGVQRVNTGQEARSSKRY